MADSDSATSGSREEAELKDALAQRVVDASHAIQSGVAWRMGIDRAETDGKHLRVGVNVAMVEHGALALLLIRKGIITELEYLEAVAEGLEAEKARYEAYLTKATGAEIDLV